MRVPLLPENSSHGWTPYAYLVYLTPFLVFPLAVPSATPERWLATAAGAVTFLGLYFYGYWVRGRQRVPVVVAIALLGVLFLPSNPGACCFYIYAAAFVADIGPARVAVRWLVGLVAVVAMQAWVFALPAWAYLPALVFVPLVGALTLHEAESERKNARLRLAHDEVARLAQVAERERIGRDLHDLLGHTLSLIVLKSELAAKLAERDVDRAVAEIRDLERISRDALAEVRQAVGGYHRSSLRDEVARAREALETARVQLAADVDGGELPPVEDHVLALVVREAVTNVVRHARASACSIVLRRDLRSIELEVSDDGQGLHGPEGNGLTGMRARLEGLGGRLDVSSPRGTRLIAMLPRRSDPAPQETEAL